MKAYTRLLTFGIWVGWLAMASAVCAVIYCIDSPPERTVALWMLPAIFAIQYALATIKDKRTNATPNKRTGGFTLIELLAVITLIAILASASYGAAIYVIRATRAQKSTCEAAALQVAIGTYRQAYGQWPVPAVAVGPLSAGTTGDFGSFAITNGAGGLFLDVKPAYNHLVFDLMRHASVDTSAIESNTNNIPFIDGSAVYCMSGGRITPRRMLPIVADMIEAGHPIAYVTARGTAGTFGVTFDFERDVVTVWR